MDVPHYWTVDQVARLLGALSTHNRLQARVLALEWRDLDYRSGVPTLLVRESKSGKPRTVPLHDEMVQLFTNWPVKHSPRDAVVGLTMRTALRHIGDGIQWAGLDEELPGTGKRMAGVHSLRHSAARHRLMVGRVPLNVVSSWLGHANVQVAPDLSAHRGQHVFDGGSAIARSWTFLGQGGNIADWVNYLQQMVDMVGHLGKDGFTSE